MISASGFHQFPHAFAIRKAFAQRKNRVKYAAAEYRPWVLELAD
jgi:hypothetical protein